MTAQEFGPWVMIVIGALVLVGALLGTVLGKMKKGLWLLLVFGFALIGVGSYGPVFLSSYGNFLKVLLQIQSDPSKETYNSALQSISEGDLKPEEADVVLQYMINKPLEGIDSLLSVYSQKTNNIAAKQILTEAKITLTQRKSASDELVKKLIADGTLEQKVETFDPTTKILIGRSLLKSPPIGMHTQTIDKSKLKNWSTAIPFKKSNL